MKFKLYFLPVLVFIMCMAMTCEEDVDVYLIDVEIANLDNSGENMVKSEDAVNRNAFAIGVNYLVGHTQDEEMTFPYNNPKSYDSYIIQNFSGTPKVICNTSFDEDHPEGSDVTGFFKTSNRNDTGYDMLLILKNPPAAGTYSFKVIYNCSNGIVIEKDTEPVTLF